MLDKRTVDELNRLFGLGGDTPGCMNESLQELSMTDTLKTYKELESFVLNQEGTEIGRRKLEGRRKKMLQMSVAAKFLRNSEKQSKVKLPRSRPTAPKVTFTVNQGNVISGQKKGHHPINVEMHGKNVGIIVKESGEKGQHWLFTPKGQEVKLMWSNNVNDAEEIRKYFESITEQPTREKVKEREIQWQMFKAIQDNTNEFRHLTPVAIAGFPSEVPTWINLTGKPATGNIDALIRTKPGGNKGASFLVFELKSPSGEGPRKALQQAILYAIALSIEANADPKTQEYYRALFGSSKDARIPFGAVAVVEDTEANRRDANEVIKELNFDVKSGDSRTQIDRIGILFYILPSDKDSDTKWKWHNDKKP